MFSLISLAWVEWEVSNQDKLCMEYKIEYTAADIGFCLTNRLG